MTEKRFKVVVPDHPNESAIVYARDAEINAGNLTFYDASGMVASFSVGNWIRFIRDEIYRSEVGCDG
jgi:hypothetical protein